MPSCAAQIHVHIPRRTSEVLFGELVLLDGRAHGAVEQHDALAHRLRQVGGDLLGVLLAGCSCERQSHVS